MMVQVSVTMLLLAHQEEPASAKINIGIIMHSYVWHVIILVKPAILEV